MALVTEHTSLSVRSGDLVYNNCLREIHKRNPHVVFLDIGFM